MLGHLIRAALAAPRAPSPPARVWRDWVVLGGFLTAAALEVAFREDLPLRWYGLALALVVAPTLMWRRTHPFPAVAVAFGAAVLSDLVLLAAGEPAIEMVSVVVILVLPYSLFRWGSGREAAAGLAVILLAAALAFLHQWTGLADAIGGMAVLTSAFALGTEVRVLTNSRRRRLEQVKTEERVRLARELHDTVAHHVSAIAISAQAGRALAADDPSSAADALALIEREASRTLAEMRTMVRVLRNSEAAAYGPQPGIADVPALQRLAAETAPRVQVSLSGDLGDLPAAVDTAVYRMAQEALTNALRHASGASLVVVEVAGEEDTVVLRVHDDGEARGERPPVGPGSGEAATDTGFGLTGMAERAALLGGSFRAGPGPDRGWVVTARLPREVTG